MSHDEESGGISYGSNGPSDWVMLNAAQRAMARRMVATAHIPMAALFVDVDAEPALRVVDALKRDGVDATFTAVLVYEVAQALGEFEIIAAEFDYTESRYRIPPAIGVGVAVAAPRGLYVPVIQDAPNLKLVDLVRRLAGLVEAARSNRLRPDMQRGAHFTVSNIGGLGIHGGLPLINPPQNAILGVASVRQQPVIRNGALAIGSCVNMTLTIDHRAIDGVTAANFLKAIAKRLEATDRLIGGR